jgi:predicted phage terminase large subunit-like protein
MSLDLSEYPLPSSLAPVIWPGRYRYDWHIQQCEKITMKLMSGDIRKAIIALALRHGKSEYFSILLPFWHLLAFPEKPIIAATGTEELYRKFSRTINDLITRFGKDLANIEIDPKENRAAFFKLKGYPSSQYLCTIASGRAAQGQPADLIIADDLCPTAGLAASVRERETLSEWFNAVLMSRLDNPQAKMVVVSSRRNPQDITGELLERNKDLSEAAKWHMLKLPAISPSGKPLWPWRWNLDALQEKKKELEMSGHGYLWDSEWMQNPYDNPMYMAFKRELFEDNSRKWNIQYDVLPKLNIKATCISIDPSAGKNSKTGDNTAILYGILDHEGTIWIEDSWLECRLPPVWEAEAVAMFKKYNPNFICIEAINPQDSATHLAQTALKEGIINMPVIGFEHKSGGGDDKPRIRHTLGTLFEQHRIRFKSTNTNRRIIQEAMMYPTGRHDDGIDALEQMVQGFVRYLK